MKLSDRDAFYQTMYFHEITERDRLDDRFRTLLAIVAIVFTMLGYLFDTIVIGSASAPLLFWVVYSLAVISFCAAVVCYIKAWHGEHYTAFPLLDDIEQYIAHIRETYQELTDEHTAEQWSDEAFRQFMRQSFIDHASFNTRANDYKRFWLYYGNSFVIGAFAFGIMAFIPVSQTFISPA